MKQLFQNLSTGDVELVELPMPYCGANQVLVRTQHTLVSLGTERMLADFGRASWLQKAKQQPEKVQQVVQKIRTDGVIPTMQAVRSKLGQPIPLGYCNVGHIIKVGQQVTEFQIGDLVVSNGYHAEFVAVPTNLVARVPKGVSSRHASFTVLGAIGLQGVRLLNPTLGENVVVLGLGLIGLMTVQILRANGCNVIGFDHDLQKVELAKTLGAQAFQISQDADPVRLVFDLTNGIGADGVLITAATQSNEPIQWAPQMCRQRGKVILVGVSGLELRRSDFFEKEISFQVSCSYGPGRYDPNYEAKGLDYPVGFVRWTEKRNFEAILALLAQKQLNVKPLITKHISFEHASSDYASILSDRSALGVIMDYDPKDEKVQIELSSKRASSEITLGIIGASQFGNSVLFPAVAESKARLKTLASRSVTNLSHQGKRFGFETISSDYQSVLEDPEVNCVFITTRHSSHADLALTALKNGKHVFLEKPLCIDFSQLAKLCDFIEGDEEKPILTVGFNRRFAPTARALKKILEKHHCRTFVYTINAGHIPPKHWVHDLEVGGGRLIGEACHFVDLLRFLSGSPILESNVIRTGALGDNFSIQVSFANSDIGTIHYITNGTPKFAKERLEVFTNGDMYTLENFRSLSRMGQTLPLNRQWIQNKGHKDEVSSFFESIRNSGEWPIPWPELKEVAEVCLKLSETQERGVNV